MRPKSKLRRLLFAALAISAMAAVCPIAEASEDLSDSKTSHAVDRRSLSAWFEDLPADVAVVTERYEPEAKSSDSDTAPKSELQGIVLIEDVHGNPSGQLNIANAVEHIVREGHIKTVFMEAATGNVSLSFLKETSPEEKREEVGRDYIGRGLMQGVEFTSLRAGADFSLWGVENQTLYEKTVSTYRRIVDYRTRARKHLEKARKTLTSLGVYAAMRNANDRKDLEEIRRDLERLSDKIGQPLIPEMMDIDGTPIEIFYYNNVARPINYKIRNWRLANNHTFLSESAFQFMSIHLEKFSGLIAQRDLEFLNRMIERMHATGRTRAAFVAGVYHTGNMKSHLAELGIPYIVIRPQVKAPTDFALYENLLLNQPMSIESILRIKPGRALSAANAAVPNATMIRPMMAQVPFDLIHDTRPLLLDLGRDLGPQSAKTVESVVTLIEKFAGEDNAYSVPEDLLENSSAPSWSLWSSIEKTAAAEVIQKVANLFRDISQSSDAARYNAFKRHSADFGKIVALEDRDATTDTEVHKKIQHSIRQYEDTLGYVNKITDRDRVLLISRLRNFVTPENAARDGYSWGLWLYELVTDANFRRQLGNYFRRSIGALRPPTAYEHAADEQQAIINFLSANVTETGMPLSYRPPEGYWKNPRNNMSDEIDGAIERTIVEYCVNIYDGATWQIALMLSGDDRYTEQVDSFTRLLLSGTSGELVNIRAFKKPYKYGDEKVELPEENAFFFRIISDKYLQPDPLEDRAILPDFPNFETVHHEDWKPIAGEQAWAGIIGPIQSAYMKYGGRIPQDSIEMKLALSILPAIEAMSSPIGAIYHTPWGTHGKDARDISNENNFSMRAALQMLHEALIANGEEELAARVLWVLKGQEEHFKQFAFNEKEGIFYQGGFFIDGRFIPTEIFAVDCQTWGTIVLGPEWIDKHYGEGTTYRIWLNTKRRGGYFDDNGRVMGVGFTDSHQVLSVEWTCGAIWAAQMAGEYYAKSHPEWSRELLEDSIAMRRGIETQTVELAGGQKAYHYASERFFIPFGWWANRFPSLVSSAWVIMLNVDYNPFVLGGGEKYWKKSGLNPEAMRERMPESERRAHKTITAFAKETEVEHIEVPAEVAPAEAEPAPVEYLKWFPGEEKRGIELRKLDSIEIRVHCGDSAMPRTVNVMVMGDSGQFIETTVTTSTGGAAQGRDYTLASIRRGMIDGDLNETSSVKWIGLADAEADGAAMHDPLDATITINTI